MRELLLLDLAGFRCGVWKEDILSHDEQNIHWLTDNDGPVTAIAMMGAHPVSLADLSYCLGLAPAHRSGKHPVLVPAEHDLFVGFVVEHEAGEAQIPSQRIFSLPPYLQTTFIDCCVQHDGKLIPLVNIRAIHQRVTTVGYSPPTPQFSFPAQKEKKTPSLDALRFFICNQQSFAASADFFSPQQAQFPGTLTNLPLLPAFIRGITLHNKQVHTVLDIRRFLHLSSRTEDGEEKLKERMDVKTEEEAASLAAYLVSKLPFFPNEATQRLNSLAARQQPDLKTRSEYKHSFECAQTPPAILP